MEIYALATLAAFLAAATPHAGSSDREGQWTIGPNEGGEAVARFVAWDHSLTVFTAACDVKSRQLVIRYTLAAAGFPIKGAPAIYLGPIKLKTRRIGSILEGRANIDTRLRRLLTGPNDLEITAPNEMGEPWYVGRAVPLRSVAAACQSKSQTA